jgi:hypothetical protein
VTDDKAPGSFTFEDKKPRGRPPGSKTKTAPTATQVNADVRQALATLESMYNMVSTGLLLGGFMDTFAVWQEQADKLSKTNEDALKSAPKLAAWIARAGSTGGAATLIIGHGMAAFAVAGTLRGELVERQKRATPPASQDGTDGTIIL